MWVGPSLRDTVMDNFSGRSDEEVLPNRERIMAGSTLQAEPGSEATEAGLKAACF